MNTHIKKFNKIRITDIAEVGGKNASLGEMFTQLSGEGIRVPDGFATTANAFTEFLEFNKLNEPIKKLLDNLDRKHFSNLKETGEMARLFMMAGRFPADFADEIAAAYKELGDDEIIAVAVRSSATAEDLPQASFAGQHESFLNIKGKDALLDAVQKCFASLFTNRAIKYREDNGFAHDKVAISVGVQKMVRSDKACSGVGFTLEPESGFRDLVHLSGVWGLGENIVQGTVTPDEFFIFKPTLKLGKEAIIQKKLGEKARTMIYADQPTEDSPTIINTDTPLEKRQHFVLRDDEITLLARWAVRIEEHYAKPMDIEWAKDGITNELFLIQARPETVHSRTNPLVITEYSMLEKGRSLATGQAIGSKIAIGVARVLRSPKEADMVKDGDIVVTELTSPDWDPILKKAAAIVTDKGGRTSHASIIAREIGVPAIVGCGNATGVIKDGDWITVSCCEGETGHVYEGKLKFESEVHDFTALKKPSSTEVMLIVGDPGKAFQLSFYPNDGVGLMRLEFIINNAVKIHPMALARFAEIKDEKLKTKIEELTFAYPNKPAYFVDKLSEGIAMIAAAFYPKEVIVRMSDFKTNEYANLIGGAGFEPKEENPMLGFRGASRYYNELYRDGFRLECLALKRVRENMGLDNVKIMIPFCRTLDEARKVINELALNGLDRTLDDKLEIYMMAEIPGNVLLAEKFSELFDGFSIGSNDLTQLTLGIDRDSSIISNLFSEQDPAAKMMISMMIHKARHAGVKIGLCGQAPSDFPGFARFLVEEGINSISFNADALLRGLQNIVEAEKKLNVTV